MIGARFHLKRLLERFNGFIDVAPIKFKDSAVVQRVRISRHAGSPSEALITDCEIGANTSDNFGLLREFIKQTHESVLGGNKILSVEYSKSLLECADCRE